MKLHVIVLEARGLAARDPNGSSDPFVRLSLGVTKAKTGVVYRNLNPSWNEDFFFNVVDCDEELSIMVWDEDRFCHDFLGQVKIKVSDVLTADKQTIARHWYPLQKRKEKSKNPITGEILLSLSLFGKDGSGSTISSSTAKTRTSGDENSLASWRTSVDDDEHMLSPTSSVEMSDSSTDLSNLAEMSPILKSLMSWVCSTVLCSPQSILAFTDVSEVGNDEELNSISPTFFDDDDKNEEPSADSFPPPMAGGVALDQRFAVSAKALNAIMFKSGSQFVADTLVALKTTGYQDEPWKKVGSDPIRRTVTYMKAATKLVKSVKATEVQTYTRADDQGFIVHVSCDTPDVPYGSNFFIELQFNIMAAQDLPTGEKTCRLEVSWRVNFLHNTMMKGMIESGARQGIKETYETYCEVLCKYAKPISDDQLTREALLGPKEDERPLSDYQLAWEYFGKWHVLLAVLSLLIVVVHIAFVTPKMKKFLTSWGIDLPDSLGEMFFAAIVVLQVENVVKMIYQFVRARYWQSGDHGVKAQGDGWLMTVTLIEGENFTVTEANTFTNPFVVFTCNGKRRTSSVKLRTPNPNWCEIFEFDAMEDPPSTMDVEVFDYDGPFSEAESLGHAEVNFLKQSSGDLSDFWVSLSGRHARTHAPRLHLRVFLTNTKESDSLPKYLERVEKEVGTKVAKRSATQNASFQKLFSLPAEEFLINDFACAIKRKILIQGRLFLSQRMVGFYSNLFGIKTKFTFLWEDIDEIKEMPISINPSIVVFLRKGRGLDARVGAKGIDGRGRLKFQFLSFVRPGTAFRTIVALSKNRKLNPEQQMELVAKVQAGDLGSVVAERQAEDPGPFLGEEAHMTQVVMFEFSLTTESLLLLFQRQKLDEIVSEKLGWVNYKATPWERVEDKPESQRRQLSYSLNRQISQCGSKVSCVQQKTVAADMMSCTIEEIMTLHDVPFGEHFQVHVRREVETLSENPPTSIVKALVGVAWHKDTEFKKKITKNVYDYLRKQVREMMNLTVKEIKAAIKEDKRHMNGG
ncbi:unnamed protein product [Sphagnum compactum]